MERYVWATYPRLRKVTFSNVAFVGIVSASLGPDVDTRQTVNLPQETQSNKIRVGKSIKIPARSQAEVWVQSSAAGLSFPQGNPRLTMRQHSMMATNVMEIAPTIPFRVVISNLKESPLRLHQGTIVGIALPAPIELAQLPTQEVTATMDAVATEKTDMVRTGSSGSTSPTP